MVTGRKRTANRSPELPGSCGIVSTRPFKAINDSLGGGRGLRETVRDTGSRLGGDEFDHRHRLSRRALVLVANKILEALARPFEVEGRELSSTLSMGVPRPADGGGFDTLLKRWHINEPGRRRNTTRFCERMNVDGGSGMQTRDGAPRGDRDEVSALLTDGPNADRRELFCGIRRCRPHSSPSAGAIERQLLYWHSNPTMAVDHARV